jgi:hypothetical protein
VHYAEQRIMPTWVSPALQRKNFDLLKSA